MEVLRNSTNLTSQIWDVTGKVNIGDSMIASPVILAGILLSYLAVVLKIGPEYMKSRSPMNLNNLLIIYNAAQVLVSLILFRLGYRLLQPHGLLQTKCLLNDEDLMKGVTSSIYYYLLAKVSELLDTVFFILRKKQNQLTFLHVYHHTGMVLYTWISMKYEPTFGVVFLGTINSFVHVIMYTYYGLAAFPALTKYLWWKKYITTMQLVQFGMIFCHGIFNFFYGACPPSYFLITLILFNAIFFIYLFSDFYIKSYKKSPSRAVKQKAT